MKIFFENLDFLLSQIFHILKFQLFQTLGWVHMKLIQITDRNIGGVYVDLDGTSYQIGDADTTNYGPGNYWNSIWRYNVPS